MSHQTSQGSGHAGKWKRRGGLDEPSDVALTFRAARQRLGCLLRLAAQFFSQMEGVRHLFPISLDARGQFAGFGR
jgi:hypothetical protein